MAFSSIEGSGKSFTKEKRGFTHSQAWGDASGRERNRSKKESRGYVLAEKTKVLTFSCWENVVTQKRKRRKIPDGSCCDESPSFSLSLCSESCSFSSSRSEAQRLMQKERRGLWEGKLFQDGMDLCLLLSARHREEGVEGYTFLAYWYSNQGKYVPKLLWHMRFVVPCSQTYHSAALSDLRHTRTERRLFGLLVLLSSCIRSFFRSIECTHRHNEKFSLCDTHFWTGIE